MLMGKYARKAVALVGVLAVALIGATVVGLWPGPVGPASTDPALVDPAAAMDHDAGVCIGDAVEDFSSVTMPDDPRGHHPCHGCRPQPGCTFVGCDANCCYFNCNGFVICFIRTPPEPK